MPRIHRLDVAGFRGVRANVPLILEGKSVLLFGENGTGKSSFVDALEKLLTGRVTTLDGRAQGLSSERHGPNIRDGQNPPRIAVTFDDPASTTLTESSDHLTLPPDIRKYVNSAKDNLYLLRRRQILEFIDSQPRDRYALLRPFLPLSGTEAIESAMRTAWERAEAEAQRADQEIDRLLRALLTELGRQGVEAEPSQEEVTRVINSFLERVGQPSVQDLRELDEATQRLDGALAPFGDLTRQSRLVNAERALERLSEAISSLTLDQMVARVEALRGREAGEARVFYEAVLEQGTRWIEEENRDTCPLCEQRISPGEILGRVRRRLEAMQQVLNLRRAAQQTIARERNGVRTAQEALGRAIQEVGLTESQDRGQVPEMLEEVRIALQKAGEALGPDLRDLLLETIRTTNILFREGSPLRQRLAEGQVHFRTLLASLPSTEMAQLLLATRHKIVRVREIWTQLERLRPTAMALREQAAVATKLHEDARTARREEVQDIFDELSKDIDYLYTNLHPGESHSGIHLEVREVGQGSANLKADFYDRRNEDPRAYYSDAHLDTLGLSIFLALRRWHLKERPEFGLLILDDVLTSVDVHHVVRLSELLLREFKDCQMFLTTHDRIWFEHLRDIQARCRVANTFINKVIHKWTIDEGPELREPEDERREIERLLGDGSGEQIAVMSGRLLEHILQEMRYSLRLSVQAKRGEQYELGDLWPAFYATVRRDFPMLYGESRQSLDDLDLRWPVRNWIGAHWNGWARNVPRNTAVEFAKAVRDLFDRLFCSSCRRFVAPSTAPLGQLACRCGEKIYPAAGKEAVRPKSREELIRETKGALREARLDTDLYLGWKRADAGREH